MSAPTTSIIIGDALDALRTMADGSVNQIVTSPPYYGKRDYEVDGQIGFGQSLDDYITSLVAIFRECRRILAKDGTFFLNIGDTYYDPYFIGQVKDDRFDRNDLMLVPFRVAMALQADGWLLRSHVVWHKPSVMPESVKNRFVRQGFCKLTAC